MLAFSSRLAEVLPNDVLVCLPLCIVPYTAHNVAAHDNDRMSCHP
jgi:hypothetical protein